MRVAREELPVLLLDARIGCPVDVVCLTREGRDAARDERRLQAVRRRRQIAQHAEAAEALAQDAPALVAYELAPEDLGVSHDGVRAEQRQVLRLLRRTPALAKGLVTHRARKARAALVEKQHPVILQRTPDPTRARVRPRRRGPRPALEVDEVRELGVRSFAWAQFASEHRELLTSGRCMIEGRLEVVVPYDHPRQRVGLSSRHDEAMVSELRQVGVMTT